MQLQAPRACLLPDDWNIPIPNMFHILSCQSTGGRLADPQLQAPRACLLLARHTLLGAQFTAEALTLVAGAAADGAWLVNIR